MRPVFPGSLHRESAATIINLKLKKEFETKCLLAVRWQTIIHKDEAKPVFFSSAFCSCSFRVAQRTLSRDLLTGSPQSVQDKNPTKPVERPHPLFEQYEYPGATRTAAINLSGTVSATYSSPDDYKKVVDFYREKFSGSKQVSVQETTSYFGVKNPDGSGLTATVSVASDNHTQIILRHDKAQ